MVTRHDRVGSGVRALSSTARCVWPRTATVHLSTLGGADNGRATSGLVVPHSATQDVAERTRMP